MDMTSIALFVVSATLLLTIICQWFVYGRLRREIAEARADATHAMSSAACASAQAADMEARLMQSRFTVTGGAGSQRSRA